MSKKPASLTSDLLARKGEAEPSTIDPSARMTLSAGSGFSDEEGGGGDERREPHMERDTEIRPVPPEPEIIYTAEEKGSGGSNARLIITAVLGVIFVGGIFLAISGNKKGDVAPVSPNLTNEAPAPANQMTPPADTASQPAETSPSEQAQATPPSSMDASPDTSPAATTVPATPAPTQAAEASAPEAAAPAAEAQAPAPVKTAESATPAKALTPQAGGAYVVQLLALRDEDAARAAWKKIAAKHKSILGSHALDIEKADLGSKGTWYRVRAAGFADKTAATRACNGLKAAGQDCIVKKR